jgi:uncharacterized protein (TIGR02246 family)
MRVELGKKLVENWINTLEEYNPREIVNLYSNDAILLGTLAEKPLIGRNEIESYFNDFVKLHPEGYITYEYGRRIGLGKIIVDGNYTFMLDNKKARKEVEARFTFLFKRNWLRFGRWEIVTHHSSEKPKKPTKI